jgi:tetratricopeptide (TPR) repeat protein
MVTQRSTLESLGQRLRQARLERHMSQEKLAQPEFTKSYVSAVERGKARPSLKALELMARRLEIPMNELLHAAPPTEGLPDLPALQADLSYELDAAQMLINTNRADEALRRINAAEQTAGPHLSEFDHDTRYRLYYLRARAYLRLAEPASARHELQQAMSLAQQRGAEEDVERVRNDIGGAFFEQDMPGLALEQHKQCLHAIQTGVVKDLNLRLSIYSNIANDYWALNDVEQAIGVYKESLELLEDTNNLERQSGIYWGLSLAYRAAGDLDRAKLYAGRALSIFEAADNLVAAAKMSVNLADILTARQEYDEAEQRLDRAQELLLPTGNRLYLSTVYEHYALLDLARGRLDQAADWARRSRELSESVIGETQNADVMTQANTMRTAARALRAAGLVEEQRGDTRAADELFGRALDLLSQVEYDETASEIERAYADLLVARGAHAEAATHYQAAFRHRQRRTAR